MDQSTQAAQLQLSSSGVAVPYTHPTAFLDSQKRYERIPLDRLRSHANPSPYWSKGAIYGCAPAVNFPVWWICNICHKRVKLYHGFSSNASRHIKRDHSEQEGDDNTEASSSQVQSTISTPSTTAVSGPITDTFTFRMNVKQFRYWLMRWIVEDHRPFLLVESQSFRNMLIAVNSAIQSHLPGRLTLTRWTDIAMEKAKEEVMVKLAAAQSKIHISFDMWTSPAGYGMLGVLAHAVMGIEKPVNKAVTLALRRVEGHHTAEAVGQVLLDVLLDFGIDRDRLGLFVADNASENDPAIKLVCEALNIDPRHRRVRCLAHIINLAAKAFFFGNDVEAFEAEIEGADLGDESLTTTQLEAAQQAWRDRGPIGKLHNIIIFIRSSDPRRDDFRTIRTGHARIDSLELVQDNSTRWNSYFYAIQRALEVRQRIDRFVNQYNDYLADDKLYSADWDHLKQISTAIEPFEEITKDLQSHAYDGNHGSVWEWLPAIETLLKIMEKGRESEEQEGRPHSTLAIAYHNAWLKLNKYYSLTDSDHEIYGAATILSPYGRHGYFEQHWSVEPLKAWKPVLFETVRKMWIQRYKDDEHIPKRVVKPTALDRHLGRGQAVDGDAYDQYVQEKPDTHSLMADTDVFSFWKRSLSPQLRKMAYDILSCPATSTGVERLFSSAGLTVTDRRTRTTAVHVETYELLRSWWREGITTPPEVLEQLLDQFQELL